MFPGALVVGLAPLIVGVQPHVGGIPTLAYFDAPADVGLVADTSFTLTWTDNDMDETGSFTFFYQPVDLAMRESIEDLAGTVIPGGEMLPIKNLDDSLVWDTTGVPAGSYFVYAVTTDPGLEQVFSVSKGAVTVQHPGDPQWPAVIVTAPGPLSGSVADVFAVRWQASAGEALTATVRGRGRNDAEWMELASDWPMTAAGQDGLQKGCFAWNLSTRPSGQYEVQVEVKDAAGRTHVSHARNAVTVYRDPRPIDAGVPQSCESASVDAGGGGDDGEDLGLDDGGMGPGDCGCRVGGAASAAVVPMVSLALALLSSLLRRRRRR